MCIEKSSKNLIAEFKKKFTVFWRGEDNNHSELQSSLVRFIKNELKRDIRQYYQTNFLDTYFDYCIKELPISDKLKDFIIGKRNKVGWQLLEHLSIPTNLVNVSLSPILALRFALHGQNNNPHVIKFEIPNELYNKKQRDFNKQYGISLINIRDEFNNEFSEDLRQEIIKFLAKNTNLISQEGYFLYCKKFINFYDEFSEHAIKLRKTKINIIRGDKHKYSKIKHKKMHYPFKCIHEKSYFIKKCKKSLKKLLIPKITLIKILKKFTRSHI